MNKILITLGLPETATEDDAINAIMKLQNETEMIKSARIESAVDAAIGAKKVTADKRESLIDLGKKAGFDSLQTTLDMLNPVQKPTQIINHSSTSAATVALSYSEMSEEQLRELKDKNPEEFLRLFKAEFGYVPKLDK